MKERKEEYRDIEPDESPLSIIEKMTATLLNASRNGRND